MSASRKQQGVALITALLIVAFAATMAATLLTHQSLNLQRSANLFNQEQAAWYARGAEAWAAVILEDDKKNSKIDHDGEDWATNLDYIPVDGGSLSGGLTDAQARLNLNDLLGSNGDAVAAVLERLIQNVGGEQAYNAKPIVNAIRDWLDADTQPRLPGGAEDGYYMVLRDQPPYRAANRPMVSISELRLVRNVDAALYNVLLPYVTALPGFTPININSAPAPLLAALVEGGSPADVAQLIEKRTQAPFETVQSFLAEPAFAGRQIDASLLSVDTHFFVLHMLAKVGTTRLNLYSLLYRTDNGRVQTYRHSRNSL